MPEQLAFVSYRRDDSRDWANLLADRLRSEFGPRSVFLDTDDIRGGDEWPNKIESALTNASVVLPVVGPKWLFLQDEKNGKRRIDGNDDWVRRELEYALNAARPIVPVLVYGAKVPTAEDLPQSITRLPFTQGVTLSDKSDVDKVVRLLKERYGFRRQQTLVELPFPAAVDRVPPLSETDLKAAMDRLPPNWTLEERASEHADNGIGVELIRSYLFASFEDAIHFMMTASRYITATAHHPFWENQYQTIRVRLSTWDAELKISHKDIRLAQYLDQLFRDYVPQGEPPRSHAPTV